MCEKILRYFITNECDGLEKIEYDKNKFLWYLQHEIEDYCQIADRDGMSWNLSNFVINLINNKTFSLNINGYLYEIETEEWYEK